MNVRRGLCLLFGLAAIPAAHALTYTVGPGGMHATIQAAIAAALAHPGDDDVRIHTGVYNEGLSVPTAMSADELVISGGWNDSFTAQDDDGALNTIVSPPPGARGAWLRPTGGTLVFSDLHVYGAQLSDTGAGIQVETLGDASVTITRTIVEENVLEGGGTLMGAGLHMKAFGSSAILVLGNRFLDNRATNGGVTGDVIGGAIFASCFDTTYCVIADNTISGTTADPFGGQAIGGAVRLWTQDAATAQFDRNLVEDTAVGADAVQTSGRSLYVQAHGASVVYARGDRFHGDLPLASGTETRWDLDTDAVVTFGDSLVAHSPRGGLLANVADAAHVNLVNLTLGDNDSGILLYSTSTATNFVSNCLITNDVAYNTFEGTTFANNSIGRAMPFLAPSRHDYSLREANPWVTDAGTDKPAGGLGGIDVDNGPRVRGPHVDVGAWESSDRIFADGLER